jgi:hypothetical protein
MSNLTRRVPAAVIEAGDTIVNIGTVKAIWPNGKGQILFTMTEASPIFQISYEDSDLVAADSIQLPATATDIPVVPRTRSNSIHMARVADVLESTMVLDYDDAADLAATLLSDVPWLASAVTAYEQGTIGSEEFDGAVRRAHWQVIKQAASSLAEAYDPQVP